MIRIPRSFGALMALSLLMATGPEFLPAQGPPAAGKGPAAPPPEVTFVVATPQDVPLVNERLGVVEASRVADVHTRVRGFLQERLFHEGDLVTEGQVLFRIEKDLFETTVRAREADLDDAKARLDLAVREFERKSGLSKSGVLAEEDMDRAEIERDRARAAVAGAEADLGEARLDLGYTEIVAPTSGIIGPAIRDKGDLVDPATTGALATITRISPVYVTYGISESDYLRLYEAGMLPLREDVAFRVVLRDGTEFPEAGKLNYASSQFEADTGMLRVRIEFANANRLLRPNQFVRLMEDHGVRGGVLSLPRRSVIQSPAGSAVFVIDEKDTVQFRPVKVGGWQADSWEVLSGVTAGERVLVEGFMKCAPGAPVRPIPLAAPSEGIPQTTSN